MLGVLGANSSAQETAAGSVSSLWSWGSPGYCSPGRPRLLHLEPSLMAQRQVVEIGSRIADPNRGEARTVADLINADADLAVRGEYFTPSPSPRLQASRRCPLHLRFVTDPTQSDGQLSEEISRSSEESIPFPTLLGHVSPKHHHHTWGIEARPVQVEVDVQDFLRTRAVCGRSAQATVG